MVSNYSGLYPMIRGLLILCAFLPVVVSLDPAQNKLYEHLLNGYDPLIHPSKLGKKQQLSTTINFFLYHIAVVDNADPKLKFNGFLRLQWFDERIAWNPADFGGVSEFSLPMDYKIWTPSILQTDVNMRNASFFDKPRARTNFQLFFKNRPSRALITHSYQIHGEMECFTGESFPREKLQCKIFFVNGAPLEEETFKSVSQHIVLKNIFINDVESPRLNGWRVINTRQEKLVYSVDEYNARSAIQCSIIIQRDDAPLYFVIILPLIVLGTLITGAWLTRPGISLWTCVATVYNIQLFVEDVIKRMPTYVDEEDDRIGLNARLIREAASRVLPQISRVCAPVPCGRSPQTQSGLPIRQLDVKAMFLSVILCPGQSPLLVYYQVNAINQSVILCTVLYSFTVYYSALALFPGLQSPVDVSCPTSGVSTEPRPTHRRLSHAWLSQDIMASYQKDQGRQHGASANVPGGVRKF